MRQQIGVVGRALVLFAGLVAALCFAQGAAHAQGASIDDQVAQQEFCNIAGSCGNGGGQATTQRIRPDPCYLAQNAMRPCTSDQITPKRAP